MEVKVLERTAMPERLVCTAARGDYYQGYVGDTSYAELMESVDYDEEDEQDFFEEFAQQQDVFEWYDEEDARTDARVEAQTKAFVEKQLSRGHYGPWEHPSITFAVKGVSRVTMAQITRHRHITFDIQSMRYADFSEQEIVTPKSLTDKEHFSRETGLVEVDKMDTLREEYEDLVDAQRAFYQEMVEAGVPKEDARFILPLGSTVNMTFSGNARTMMHLLNLRQRGNAQWEIRELSNLITDELQDWMPHTYDWWERKGPVQISP